MVGDGTSLPVYHRATMSDQLSLRLETDLLPDLPDLRPMLPRPLPEAFDSEDHLFEPWWGGIRALVGIGPADAAGMGVVRVVDADGVDRSAAFPELAGMAVRIAARSALLDGELVVVDAAGRADAAALAARMAGMVDGGGGAADGGRPAAFLALDLLHLDGRSLLNQPLIKRREALRRVLRPGDEVVAVPAIATEGRALYDAAVAQGIAGILARQRMSPYLPGIRSRLWRFVAATPGIAIVGEAEADALSAPTAAAAAGATAPVLALISRLPLDDDS
jgi:bifunctional non-homologous end joining protein LigD